MASTCILIYIAALGVNPSTYSLQIPLPDQCLDGGIIENRNGHLRCAAGASFIGRWLGYLCCGGALLAVLVTTPYYYIVLLPRLAAGRKRQAQRDREADEYLPAARSMAASLSICKSIRLS